MLRERPRTSIGVGIIVLLGWIPLRERPGVGTVMNVFVIGATMDLTLALVDRPEPLWARVLYLAFGVWLWGPGSGLYLAVGYALGGTVGIGTLVFALGVGAERGVVAAPPRPARRGSAPAAPTSSGLTGYASRARAMWVIWISSVPA